MTIHMIRWLGVAVMVTGMAHAQAPAGEKWRVTNSMSMMGMNMPGRTSEICKQPGDDAPPVTNDKNCQITDVQRRGNQTSMNMHCTGEHKVDGTLVLTYMGPDHYSGDMKMQMEGQTMTMKFEGQKLGACDGKETNIQAKQMIANANAQADAYKKQADAQMAATCSEMASKPDTTSYMLAQTCKDPKDKATFCSTLQTHDGFDRKAGMQAQYQQYPQTGDTAMSHPLDDSAKYCGVNVGTVRNQLCQSAEAADKLVFLVHQCDAQAAVLAKAQCTGRNYTTKSVKYGNFCAAFAAKMGASSEGDGASQSSKPSVKDKAKGALKSLGGLF